MAATTASSCISARSSGPKWSRCLRGELQPAGERVAADDGRAEWAIFHGAAIRRASRTASPAAGRARRRRIRTAVPRVLRRRRRPRVRTLGGWPARVSRSATSALIALTSMQPPTVEPGETGVSRPSIVHHRVARRRARVEHEVGEVLKLQAGGCRLARSLRMTPADDRTTTFTPRRLKPFGHLDRARCCSRSTR